jgi:hypothetical protein
MDTKFWWGKLLENSHMKDREKKRLKDNIKLDLRGRRIYV